MRILGITAVSLLTFVGCVDSQDADPSTEQPAPTDPAPSQPTTPDGPAAALSDDEAATLRFVREEEKLARDVYGALADYGQVFANIQASEQRHFDTMGELIVTYGLEDPAAGTAPGEFTNPDLQALYDELVTRGAPDRLAALGVGCAIEELDIRDLDDAIAATTHADIATAYENLMLGSRNHLRAFYGQLTTSGGSYTPIYIDQVTFDAIVSSPKEQGGM